GLSLLCLSRFCVLCFRCCGSSRALHSFPTRRSSDLQRQPLHEVLGGDRVRPVRGHRVAAVGAGAQHHRGPERGQQALVLVPVVRSEEHTSELQSRENLVCRLLLEKKKKIKKKNARTKGSQVIRTHKPWRQTYER